MAPILFCNIAWMKTYTGDPTDEPIGGGSHPVKEEKNNFNPFNGQMFGYVPTAGLTISPRHRPNATFWNRASETSKVALVALYGTASLPTA